MKKVSIIVVLLAFVLMGSTVAFAGCPDPCEGLNGKLDDTIGLDLIIGKYAEVMFTADGPFELIYCKPQPDDDYDDDGQEAVFIPFTVKTNTPITITINETMTPGLVDQIGADKVWPFADNPPSDAVVAPYLALTDGDKNFGAVEETNNGGHKDDGWILTIDQIEGTSMDYHVFVENKWLSEDGKWWELIAGTYNYQITATIAAQ